MDLTLRPALALLTAAAVTLARAMGPAPLNARMDFLLSAGTLILFVAGAIGCGWAYLSWGSASLIVGEGRLVVRKGVPGVRLEQREVLLARVNRVDVRWPGVVPRAWQCADILIGIAGGNDIRFRLAADANAARDALLEHSQARVRTESVAQCGATLVPPAACAQAATSTPLLPADASGALAAPNGGRLAASKPWRGGSRVWRRHIWWPLRRSFGPVALGLLGVSVPDVWQRLGLGPDAAPMRTVEAALAVVAAVWLVWLWLGWWCDRLYVRDARLIHLAGFPFGLVRRESTVPLAHAVDFALRVPSPFAHLLDYGDIAIGMAGSARPSIYRCLRHPQALVRAIRDETIVEQLDWETTMRRAPIVESTPVQRLQPDRLADPTERGRFRRRRGAVSHVARTRT